MENREYKDSMFKDLFSIPKNSAELINALLDTNYKEEDIENVTLSNVLRKDIYNDLAFLTKENELIVLIEHQSTLNCNMPLRMLLYLVDEYKRIIDANDLNLYRNTLISLPTPKFFVIYTNEQAQEQQVLKLSDCFQGETSFELEVVCYNILKSNILGEKSKTIQEYATFIQLVFTHLKEKMSLKQAIEKAMEDCQRSGTLETYLKNRRSEVFDMLALEFDIDKLQEASYADGIEEGLLLAAKKMIEKGKSYEEVSKILDIPQQSIENYMKRKNL